MHIPLDEIHLTMLSVMQKVPMSESFGKSLRQMIRPPSLTWASLSYLSGMAVGGKAESQIVVTAAVMLAREASAILDDIQDGDITSNAEQAMNIAVTLAFAAQLAFAELRHLGVSSERILQAQADYASVVMEMCSGQFNDLAAKAELELNDYLAIVAAKNASFCAISCRLAAFIAGHNDLAHFEEFGRQIGFMQQIANDCAGFYGYYGKNDLGHRWTWPTLYALNVARPDIRQALLTAWPHNIAEVRRLAVDLGTLHYLLLLSNHHAQQAQKALNSCDCSESRKQDLLRLVERFQLANYRNHETP